MKKRDYVILLFISNQFLFSCNEIKVPQNISNGIINPTAKAIVTPTPIQTPLPTPISTPKSIVTPTPVQTPLPTPISTPKSIVTPTPIQTSLPTSNNILFSTIADGNKINTKFSSPNGIVIDNLGNIFITSDGNHKIIKISSTGVISNFAGSDEKGFNDGIGTNAMFSYPQGIVIDNSNNIFVSDGGNKIRKITSTGVVSTIYNNTKEIITNGIRNDGTFSSSQGIVIDSSNNIFVANSSNTKIIKISPTGVISNFAGSDEKGFNDGIGTNAKFASINGLGIDSSNNIFVSDGNNNKIRKITSSGIVSTFAGSTRGFSDGIGINSQFSFPRGLAIDKLGNIFVADNGNIKIRKITSSGIVSTINNDSIETNDKISYFSAVTIDSLGNIFFTDGSNNKIKKITLK